MDGKLPREKMREFIADVWKATKLSYNDTLSVCFTEEKRTVTKGGIRLDGRVWTCPEIDQYLRPTVIVRVPKYSECYNEVLVFSDRNEFLGIAKPDEILHFTDERGAKRSSDRKSAHYQSIRSLDASVQTIDVEAEYRAIGRESKPLEPNRPDRMAFNAMPASAELVTAKFVTSDEKRQRRNAELKQKHAENRAFRAMLDTRKQANG